MQAAIQKGEIERIEAMLREPIETEKRLAARAQIADASGNRDELGFLSEEIRVCQAKREALIVEKAGHAVREVQIRFLLELLDEMNGEGDCEETEYPPECREVDDFFNRTRHKTDEGVIVDGRVTRFDNDLVIRYIDKVTVLDNGLEVKFKAGITVKV